MSATQVYESEFKSLQGLSLPIKILLLVTTWPFVLAMRITWQMYPEMWACLLFWAVALFDEPLRFRFLGARRRIWYGIALTGAIGNAIATLLNGGVMPVLGKETQTSLWGPLTAESRVPWLCDVYGGFSLGDFFIVAALMGLLANWLFERAGVYSPESKLNTKRLPGIGIG